MSDSHQTDKLTCRTFKLATIYHNKQQTTFFICYICWVCRGSNRENDEEENIRISPVKAEVEDGELNCESRLQQRFWNLHQVFRTVVWMSGDSWSLSAHLRVVGVTRLRAPPHLLWLHPVALHGGVMFTGVKENTTKDERSDRMLHHRENSWNEI